jgi:molybdopterin molybdotransferase
MSQPAGKLDSETFKLNVAQAQQRIWQDCTPISDHQTVTVHEALYRVLAEPIYSPINVPATTNSAVDGYAVRHADVIAADQQTLAVIGTAWAGSPYHGRLSSGQAVRIMTGAVIPEGANCVIMQEQVQASQDRIEIRGTHQAGDNIRQAGEDLAQGEKALDMGRRLQPADMGLIASLGINEIQVYRKLRVAFFSSGNELRSLGEPLAKGQIYDSNRYTLTGMLQAMAVELIDLGVVPDDPVQLQQTLQSAAAGTDAIITSGGVSVGDADYIRDVMQRLGTVNFWQIAMKPGRPLAYGRVAGTPIFGLPGNPVAVMVTFYQFVRPALLKLSGVGGVDAPHSFRVRSRSSFRKKPGRTEYQRGVLSTDEQGELWVRSFGKQGSGILRSMSEADCLVVLPHDSDTVHAGDYVEVQPFYGLIQ